MYEDPQQASPPRGPRWPEGQTPPPVQPPSAQYAQQPKSGGPLKGCMIALGVVVACGLLLVFVLVMLAIVGGAQIVGVSTVDSGVRLEEVVVSGSSVSPKVACIPIQGIIQGSSMPGMESSPVAVFAQRLRRARQDDSVVAVLLFVDSPGGGVTASDIMYEELMRFREETNKPVVTCMMNVAASGGYYVAAASDRIVAHPTTITGSIGVMMLHFDVTGLLEKVGVEDESLTTGEFKDTLSPTAKKDEGQKATERTMLQVMLDEMEERFVGAVAKGRKRLTRDEVAKLADGRIFTAKQAKANKLIDVVGYREDAVGEVRKLTGEIDLQLVRYRRVLGFMEVLASQQPIPGIKVDLLESISASRSATPMFLWSPGVGPAEDSE